MRLININTFRLEEFIKADMPAYAILSHTWEDEEVSYAEMFNLNSLGVLSQPKYEKIRGCADLAKSHKLGYIWVDTCCIDKSSSAELQEAINSMFRWYKRAEVCFVYLSDYLWDRHEGSDRKRPSRLELSKSRWITRGWTLQELIAPNNVRFYDSSWTYLGDKKEHIRTISEATGISWTVLFSGDLDRTSVAQRMSWASTRNCTRVEDIAYSLMGIFNINMPMLYGEGDNAFLRLQEEIIRTTFDQSIFAWTDQDPDKAGPSVHRGILARSPKEFALCTDIVSRPNIDYSVPYSVTNLGALLETTLGRMQTVQFRSEQIYVATLKDIFNSSSSVGILLKRLSPTSNQFARVCPHILVTKNYLRDFNDLESTLEKIFVKQEQAIPKSYLSSSVYGFQIMSARAEVEYSTTREIKVSRVWPTSQWSQDQLLMRAQTGIQKTLAAIWFESFRNFDNMVLLLSFEPATLEKRCHFVRSIPVDTQDNKLETAIENELVGVPELNTFYRGAVARILYKGYGAAFGAALIVNANLREDKVVLDLDIHVS